MIYSVALSETFTPGPLDIVVGKGKKYYNHEGNKMLRRIAASRIGEYEQAKSKVDKSCLISNVVDSIREKGAFVKFDQKSKHWLHAEELLCREKTSAVFREALQSSRKNGSSKAPKRQRVEKVVSLPMISAPVISPPMISPSMTVASEPKVEVDAVGSMPLLNKPRTSKFEEMLQMSAPTLFQGLELLQNNNNNIINNNNIVVKEQDDNESLSGLSFSMPPLPFAAAQEELNFDMFAWPGN